MTCSGASPSREVSGPLWYAGSAASMNWSCAPRSPQWTGTMSTPAAVESADTAVANSSRSRLATPWMTKTGSFTH